jgi:hypothetical protein
MTSMRVLPIAAIMTAITTFGLTLSAAAQMFGPGMPMPGQAPPQQQQLPPCFKDFAPLRAEAEKRANAIKNAMEKKLPREEVCGLFKQFTAAESKVVKFVQENAQWCGIPAEAGQAMKANHTRSLKTQKQICDGGAIAGGVQKPTGPGLSEALGTNRPLGGSDPTAPQSGTMNTLSGNVLSR